MGAFSPWVKEEEVLDLHGMSVDVAKVAVFATMNDMLLGPANDITSGLNIVVGRGVHSEEGIRLIAPAVHSFLTRFFMFDLPPLDIGVGKIKLFLKDIHRVRANHPVFKSWREELEQKKALSD